MKLLLDTHILLWWYLDSPEIPKKHLVQLNEAEGKGEPLGLSIISLWEIAKLVSSGKIQVSFSVDHWFQQLEDDPIVRILPLSSSIILESVRLGEKFHKDPADQLIVATARFYGCRLMTVDERIVNSGTVLLA